MPRFAHSSPLQSRRKKQSKNILSKSDIFFPFQNVLDHQKASEALHELSYKIKRIAFLPEKNLHNICSFQELMTKFCNHYGDLYNIQAFCYVFPCDFARKHNEVDIYGTGGTILQGMKSLLMKLPGLKKVELVDLQLDVVDGIIPKLNSPFIFLLKFLQYLQRCTSWTRSVKLVQKESQH